MIGRKRWDSVALGTVIGPSVPLLPAPVGAELGLLFVPGGYCEPCNTLPVERCPIIYAKDVEGAAFREVAAEEGASHEVARQVVK